MPHRRQPARQSLGRNASCRKEKFHGKISLGVKPTNSFLPEIEQSRYHLCLSEMVISKIIRSVLSYINNYLPISTNTSDLGRAISVRGDAIPCVARQKRRAGYDYDGIRQDEPHLAVGAAKLIASRWLVLSSTKFGPSETGPSPFSSRLSRIESTLVVGSNLSRTS